MELIFPALGLIVWAFLALTGIIIPIFTIYKLSQNNNLNSDKKLIWLLVILFFPFLGAIAYFIMSKNNSIV